MNKQRFSFAELFLLMGSAACAQTVPPALMVQEQGRPVPLGLAKVRAEVRVLGGVAETKQQNWTPVEDLVIALPKMERPQVVVEKADDGQAYFAILDYPAAPDIEWPVFAPQHVALFWDASGSRTGDHKREIEVLKRYLGARLSDRFVGKEPKIAVDLVLLRNAASKPVRLEFSKSDSSALVAALDQVPHDGGTELGAIGPLAGGGKPDFYLLFTDGISNFGREEPARLDAPLYVFSAAATANHAFLHGLALTNGGQYFNLANWKDTDVVAQVVRMWQERVKWWSTEFKYPKDFKYKKEIQSKSGEARNSAADPFPAPAAPAGERQPKAAAKPAVRGSASKKPPATKDSPRWDVDNDMDGVPRTASRRRAASPPGLMPSDGEPVLLHRASPAKVARVLAELEERKSTGRASARQPGNRFRAIHGRTPTPENLSPNHAMARSLPKNPQILLLTFSGPCQHANELKWTRTKKEVAARLGGPAICGRMTGGHSRSSPQLHR